ncbi:MAG: AAA family ATPase [Clostridiales Family XIII bacterium]|nr:AAA family ATPase [Clostridiales Family XIII bacterium]
MGAIIGFTEFKQALREIGNYMQNLKKTGGRANYNIILVKNCEADCAVFTDMLYDFYYAHGAITDPMLVDGELWEAVETGRDTAFLYKIDEDWPNSDGGILKMSHEEKQLRRILKRKTIYVTEMTKSQYERARHVSVFKAVFPTAIHINEMNCEEKLEYLRRETAAYGFTLKEGGLLKSEFIKATPDVIHAGVAAAVKAKMMERADCKTELAAQDFKDVKDKKRNRKSPFDELEDLTGLDSVKGCIREIATYVKNRGKDSLPCLHMVFRGNPGTGKTTVARILGKIFADIGALKKKDVFIEADRNKLVCVYLGGTAEQTSEVVKSALGGVLFIDEAYSLNNGEKYDYGRESVNALVKLMEDHRQEFVCIMAGYTKEMDEMLDTNPGLRERVQFYIDFPDYSASELTEIFVSMCRENKYRLNAAARRAAESYFARIAANKDPNFANGRIARKVFERVKFKQAMRGVTDTVVKGDIENAFADSDLMKLCGDQKERRIGF